MRIAFDYPPPCKGPLSSPKWIDFQRNSQRPLTERNEHYHKDKLYKGPMKRLPSKSYLLQKACSLLTSWKQVLDPRKLVFSSRQQVFSSRKHVFVSRKHGFVTIKLRRKRNIPDSKSHANRILVTFQWWLKISCYVVYSRVSQLIFGKTSLTFARLKSNYQIVSYFTQSEL